MIEYKYPEELYILIHYAKKMEDMDALKILETGVVTSKDQASILSKFYWSMLDIVANDQGSGMPILEQEGIESWMEYIFHSLNGYLISNGYEDQWDQE